MTLRSVVPLAALLAACVVRSGPPGTLPPVPAPPPVLRLMECVECWSHELPAVVALGPQAVPWLGVFARSGPPVDRVARLAAAMAASLTDSAVAPLPPLADSTRDAVIATQVAAYRATYQVRAAEALGSIGGTAARDQLCLARATGQPAVVLAAINAALAAMGASCP